VSARRAIILSGALIKTASICCCNL
jgi:hypothetical protein